VGRRSVLLVVAVLIAAAGAGLIFAYVHGVNSRAMRNEAYVKVLVAKQPIAAGTSAKAAEQAGGFQLVNVPRRLVIPGAVSDITPIADQVALAAIEPNDQISTSKFGSQGQTSGLAIAKGNFAVSVQLSEPARVAGFVTPGSAVTVMATVDNGAQTRVVLPRAIVLAVGTSTAAGQAHTTDASPASAIITLSVNQVQAEKLIEAQSLGDLYLGLLDADSTVSSGASVTRGTLFK
jgi:pilus assembly protein CpaB